MRHSYFYVVSIVPWKKNARINFILLRRFWFFRHFFGRGKFGLNCSEYNENRPGTKFLFFFSVATVEIGGGGGGGNGKKKTWFLKILTEASNVHVKNIEKWGNLFGWLSYIRENSIITPFCFIIYQIVVPYNGITNLLSCVDSALSCLDYLRLLSRNQDIICQSI